MVVRATCHAVCRLHEAGWDGDRVASKFSHMLNAAGRSIVNNAATHAEMDSSTGEFTVESLERCIDVVKYGKLLANSMLELEKDE